LPPCHIGYQFFTEELTIEERVLYMIGRYNKEIKQYMSDKNIIERSTINLKLEEFNIPTRKISLSYNMRSVDWILGQPSDHIVYGLLLEMVAQSVNMIPNELIITSGDTHIYQNHIIPELYQMLEKEAYGLPRLNLNPDIKNIFDFKFEDIEIKNYISHDKIYFPLSN
jgi:thymidylate synthase